MAKITSLYMRSKKKNHSYGTLWMQPQKTELQIKELLQENITLALETIYDQMGERLYRYILSILCSEVNADEVMQNLFVVLAKKRSRVAKSDNLTGYIFAMARNQAMSFVRSEARNKKILKGYKNIIVLKEPVADRPDKVDLANVNRILLSLPRKQREVIVMKLFQEMTFKVISKTLNISPNTAASRYRNGLKKMRNKVGINKNG